MGPMRYPETSVKDYHSALRYTPEERRSVQQIDPKLSVCPTHGERQAAVATPPKDNVGERMLRVRRSASAASGGPGTSLELAHGNTVLRLVSDGSDC
jgi:hypothetical protein